jgi:transcription factor SFP1
VIHEAVDLGLSIEEAEERNRPYVCAVGAGCKKRYRQMNGLKVSQTKLTDDIVLMIVPLPELWRPR